MMLTSRTSLRQWSLNRGPYSIIRSKNYSQNVLNEKASLEEIKFEKLDIKDRMKEKKHRLLYYKLTRPLERYGADLKLIQPTIQHLLVKFQMDHMTDAEQTVSFKGGLRSNSTPRDCLEPITSHIILLLDLLKSELIDVDKTNLRKQQIHLRNTVNVHRFLEQKYLGKNHQEIIKNQIDLIVEQEVLQLIEKVGLSSQQLNNDVINVLKDAVFSFLVVSRVLALKDHNGRRRETNSKLVFEYKYTVMDDLVPWMTSLMSPTVTNSCESLTNVRRIPPFVTSNVLLRTPLSRNEFYLQMDIWSTFMKSILEYYESHKKSKYMRDCFDNLLSYGVKYDPFKIPVILYDMSNFISSTKSATISFEFLSPSFINSMIWHLLFGYFKSNNNKPEDVLKIIKSHECLVEILSKVVKPLKAHEHLNLQGYMGIVLAINYVSKDKSRKFFKFAEERFLSTISIKDKTNKELTPYYITKIAMMTTPEEIINEFNAAILLYPTSSSLWLTLIRKLVALDMMTQKRSLKIIDQLVDHEDEILLTKDMLLLLFIPMTTPRATQKLIRKIARGRGTRESKLLRLHSDTLLRKYMSVLYRNPEMKSRYNLFRFWDTGEENKTKGHYLNEEVSLVTSARYAYKTLFKIKTSGVIGDMLKGEAPFDPKNVYDLYRLELSTNNLLPDELCLDALLSVAIMRPPILWNEMYAPQVSIHEFKKHVAQDVSFPSDLDTAHLRPGAYLWQKYIMVLRIHGYVSELSQIIQWWERLDYTPSYSTLLLLLGSLPPEFGERYVTHNEKVKNDSVTKNPNSSKNVNNWPWPSLSELRNYELPFTD